MDAYDRIEREPAPKRIRDWTERWATLEPISGANSEQRAHLERFCERKRISVAALEAMGARLAVRKGARALAFAGHGPTGAITAIKYRPLDGTSHDSDAEAPSTWMRPIVIGRRDALEWFVAEGETDAARLHKFVGEAAAVLVLPSGAKTFKSLWAAEIPRGATVYLCHDADDAGDEGSSKAARILGGNTIRLRPPEGLDWCDWEGDRAAFLELGRLAKGETSNNGLVLVDPKDVAIRNVDWLIRGYLPMGELTILQGHGGTNKGTLTCHWAARVTHGQVDGPDKKPATVLFVVAEDDYERILKPRLIAAGANLELVRFVEFHREGVEGSIVIPDDIPALRAAIESTGTRLTIIDPLMSHLGGSVDSHRDQDVKRALRPLSKMANATGCTISGVHHFTKDTSKGALRSGQGSGAFGNTPRAVLAMAADPENEELRVLEVVKSNVSRIGLRQDIQIKLVQLDGLDDPVPVAVPTGVEGKTVEQLLQAARDQDREQQRASDAAIQEVILRELAGGERTRKQLDDAVHTGTGSSGDATYRYGLARLKEKDLIEARKDGLTGGWYWTLKTDLATMLEGATEPPLQSSGGASFPNTNLLQSSIDKPFSALSGKTAKFELCNPDIPPRASNGTPAALALTPEQQQAFDDLFDENGKLR